MQVEWELVVQNEKFVRLPAFYKVSTCTANLFGVLLEHFAEKVLVLFLPGAAVSILDCSALNGSVNLGVQPCKENIAKSVSFDPTEVLEDGRIFS